MKKFTSKIIMLLLILLLSANVWSQSNTQNYFTIENYYKVKWGYAEEFISLWKKNHYKNKYS